MVGRQQLRSGLLVGFGLLAGGYWLVAPALALEPEWAQRQRLHP